jgi:hypothetical protein
VNDCHWRALLFLANRAAAAAIANDVAVNVHTCDVIHTTE